MPPLVLVGETECIQARRRSSLGSCCERRDGEGARDVVCYLPVDVPMRPPNRIVDGDGAGRGGGWPWSVRRGSPYRIVSVREVVRKPAGIL